MEITESHRAENKPRATYQPESHCEFKGKILSLYYYLFVWFFFYFRRGFVGTRAGESECDAQALGRVSQPGAACAAAAFGTRFCYTWPAGSSSFLIPLSTRHKGALLSPLHRLRRLGMPPSGPWPTPLGPEPPTPWTF